MKLLEQNKLVLIGASTGGPGQVQKIISSLPILQDCTVIVAQHMVDDFLPSFTQRLSTLTSNKVIMAIDKEPLLQNYIYVCHGHTEIIKHSHQYQFSQIAQQNNEYNPEINAIFQSFVPFTKELKILAIILTGIGDDGVRGCKALSENGARTMTESEQSAIVDGMPNRARALIEDIEILDIEEIVTAVQEFVND